MHAVYQVAIKSLELQMPIPRGLWLREEESDIVDAFDFSAEGLHIVSVMAWQKCSEVIMYVLWNDVASWNRGGSRWVENWIYSQNMGASGFFLIHKREK